MPSVLAWPAGEGPEAQPYQALLYGELRKRGWTVKDFTPGRLLRHPQELIHVHWPDLVLLERRPPLRFLKTAAFLALFALARLRGRRLVWTLHNTELRDEQRSPWGRVYVRALIGLCSGLVLLSPRHVELLSRRARRKPLAVVPHPELRTAYGEPREGRAAKERLGIGSDELVVGFFGKVRPYKQLSALASAFAGLPGPGLRLLVAGEFDASCAALATGLRHADRTSLLDRHVPRDEVAWVLAAMDLVVLPYREIGNSGVALLALSYARRLLAPASAPAMSELRKSVGGNWVQLYEGELQPHHLRQALERRPETSEPDLAAFAPGRVGELTDRFLRSLLAAAPQPPRP
ncbi:MAG: hypothetical protein ABR581_05590 [Thermoleophilaceae bacterium]